MRVQRSAARYSKSESGLNPMFYATLGLKPPPFEKRIKKIPMQFKERRKKDIHLDITPIVDTVFNLLIFFALSLNFTSPSSLPIKLPKIASKDFFKQQEQITIEITKEGEIFLNQTAETHDSLQKKLVHLKSQSPESKVVLRADERVYHGKVVIIMDLCKKAGFNKISIAAQID